MMVALDAVPYGDFQESSQNFHCRPVSAMTDVSTSMGWFGIFLAILFWGSWASFLKVKRVQNSRISSVVLQVRCRFLALLPACWYLRNQML